MARKRSRPSTKAKRRGLTPRKARKILHDKSVRGHPLTKAQRGFFGAVASSGRKKKGRKGRRRR